jgi:hypothetical protein
MEVQMKPYFEGWYFKQQANGLTLAIIPGRTNNGAFIQIITDKESFIVPFSLSEYRKCKFLRIECNRFSKTGITLNIKRHNITLTGSLRFQNLTPLKGHIMGPFCYLPMECRHRIISMKHDVRGEITLNGEKLDFNNGIGYIEADSGHSFPEKYSWVQSNDFRKNCSITAAVAKIPIVKCCNKTVSHFWGCICIIWLDGKELRLATYKGAKVLKCRRGKIEIKQGKYQLTITVNQKTAQRLAAPHKGMMSRNIKESVSCPARFTLRENGKIIFDETSDHTSYEYVSKP